MDDGTRRTAIEGVEAHVREFFAGHEVEAVEYDLGEGRRDAVPGLRVLVVAPGPRGSRWTYVTAGCRALWTRDGAGTEFLLTAAVRDQRFVDLAAMVAHYHASYALDLAHSVPLGRPLVPGASCDHLLVTLPHPYGPALEHCPLPAARTARLLWLLPVTGAEIAFRRATSHEALEERFGAEAIDPTDPFRPSVA